MIEPITKPVRAAKHQDLDINECKTKYMVLNEQQKGRDANSVVNAENGKHYNFERVGNFNYSCVTLPDSGEEEIAIIETVKLSGYLIWEVFEISCSVLK